MININWDKRVLEKTRINDSYVPVPRSALSYYILASLQKRKYTEVFKKVDRREVDVYQFQKFNTKESFLCGNALKCSNNMEGCYCVADVSTKITGYEPRTINPKIKSCAE